MKQALVLALAVAFCGAASAEEETIAVKVTVKGMSCPDGCGTSVSKSLSKLEGAKDVKLTDFETGLFTVSFDAKSAVKPANIQKAVGKGYEVAKVEATLAGTVSAEKDALVLKTASGAKYVIVTGAEQKCDADAKKDAKALEIPKADDTKAAAANVAKVRAWLAENKSSVKVTGVVAENCCDDVLSVSAKSVELVGAVN